MREPILIDAEGRIVDGRNRYRACLAAEVDPRFVEWQGEGKLEEVALSLNLHRRHLNESQRAMVGARLAKLQEAEAGQRRGARTDFSANLPTSRFGDIRNQAGVQVNVSARSVGNALKVLRFGCEELIAAVEQGGLAVSAAAKLTRLPAPDQRLALTTGKKRAARPRRAADKGEGPGSFGSVLQEGGEESIAFLWVAPSSLHLAAQALRKRGFREGDSIGAMKVRVDASGSRPKVTRVD